MFNDTRRVARSQHGFTIVELLTVIALIITIAALAVPNFTAMIKEQRVTAAINSLQVAIMRARTYAVNQELDHSVEFCRDQDNKGYFRIEAESAFLENMPNMATYLSVAKSMRAIPRSWYYAFLSHRDAWGPDGIRLLTGVTDNYWTAACYNDEGWGHLSADWTEPAWRDNYSACRMYYDYRYPYPDKATLTRPWRNNSYTGWVSSGEYTNNAGITGYQDVNDDYTSSYGSSEWYAVVMDNLAVDDFLYLPFDIVVDYDQSTLINYDMARNSAGLDVCRHGWDATPDLRFGKTGYLLQSESPSIVLKRGEDQYIRLQLIRGTGRLKRMMQ